LHRWVIVIQSNQRGTHRGVNWGVRLGAQEPDEFRIVEPHRALPEIARFQHLAEYGDERTGSECQNPRESADCRVRIADDPLNGMGNLDAWLEPMATEVEYIEVGKLRLPVEQLGDSCRHIRQVGPSVAGIRPARIQDGTDGFARLDQALRKPAVAGTRPEEVAGAHDERAHAVPAGGFEALLHFHAILPFRVVGFWGERSLRVGNASGPKL
jgi:hypothetical protein